MDETQHMVPHLNLLSPPAQVSDDHRHAGCGCTYESAGSKRSIASESVASVAA